MIQFGRKIDIRDGKAYRTVLMPDGKWWMAENLDYAGEGGPGLPGSGRIYTISEANAACIAGCRVPTQEGSSAGDWHNLVQSLDEDLSIAGAALKSTSGWSVNGTDKHGFNAKPSGIQQRTYPISAWDPISSTSDAFWIGYLSASYSGIAWIKGSDSFVSLTSSDSNEVVRGAVRLIVESGNIPDGLTLSTQPSPGTFKTPQLVSIVSPEGAVVRYTTDGSTPTDTSPVYRGPIRLAAPTLLRAKIEGIDGITDLPFVIQGRPLDMYKQNALFADGKTSQALITRNQTL